MGEGEILDGDEMPELEEPGIAPEYMDEIDIISEGAMEREIMMDQIRMAEMHKLQKYNEINLRIDDNE